MPFNFLQDGFHLLHLTLPFFLSHLRLSSEKFLVRFAVATTQTVPQCGELSVIVVEVQVVHGVASGTVDDRTVGDVFSVMDKDGPEIYEAEKNHIGEFLERENKGEDMVRHALRPAIKRMECVRRKRRRHDPLVVWLVKGAVDQRVMQAAVNPVDEEVSEQDEKRELDKIVKRERGVRGVVV